ncbi:MAG: DUF3631 domain-containing protein [Thermoleophilia bacterium]
MVKPLDNAYLHVLEAELSELEDDYPYPSITLTPELGDEAAPAAPPVVLPAPVVPAKQRDIDLATLLDCIVAALERYVVFHNDEQALAVALWALHTHTVQQVETTPYLAVLSPERRCGKTRLLDVLELLVARPWRVIAPSEAVLFRQIAAVKPTLMLDEVDAIYSPRNAQAFEGIRALLNAGNRVGTQVPRCVGDGANLKVQNFDVYGAKALAGIGQLPDTVADRSVLIRLARKAPGETVARFRQRDAAAELSDLRTDITAWSETTTDLDDDRPELPDELDDRAQDSWEPLLAIADRAGGTWPARARQAALVLSLGRNDDNTSLGIKLLADLRAIFADEEALATVEILSRLRALDESPWADLHGAPITPQRLAALLKTYDVHPRTVRIGSVTAKGYRREDLFEPWQRYLPALLAVQPSQPSQPSQSDQTTDFRACDADESVTAVAKSEPSQIGPGRNISAAARLNVTAVTDVTPDRGEAAPAHELPLPPDSLPLPEHWESEL